MNAVLLTDEELAQLKALVSNHAASSASLKLALAHPVPDVLEHHGDISDLIGRARGASRYIDEDFGDFLVTFKAARQAHKEAIAARNDIPKVRKLIEHYKASTSGEGGSST